MPLTPAFCAHKVTRRVLYSTYTFACVLSALLCLYSITSPRWYGGETNREANGVDAAVAGGLSIAPWFACGRTNAVWACQEITITGLAANGDDCPIRSEAMVRSYTYAIRAFIILTGAFMALGGVLSSGVSAMGPGAARKNSILLSVISGLAVVCNIVGIALAADFYKNRLYCGGGYCLMLTESDPTLDCKEHFFHAAYVYFIGFIVPVFSFLLAVFLASTAGKTAVAQPPISAPTNTTSKSAAPFHEAAAEQPSPFTAINNEPHGYRASSPRVNDTIASETVTFQPPPGDWEWDPNSNMYWSESQYLFLNPNDGHFFDPNSEQWYNPDTQQWSAQN